MGRHDACGLRDPVKGHGKNTMEETAMEVIIIVPLPHIFQIHLVESIKHVVVAW